MTDADRLLELIEEGIVMHGGDLGGWTRRADGELQLFDGRVTLRASVDPPSKAGQVHAHVLTTLHAYGDEVLEACLIGLGDSHDAALKDAAMVWIICVAGPIRSFLDDKPVCATCRAGVAGGDASKGYSPGDYGLPGLRAWVGPSFMRQFKDGARVGTANERVQAALDDTKPWFRFAAESAAARRVHLVKVSISSNEAGGWRRAMEVDGHDVSYNEPDWPVGIGSADTLCYMTRYAVFEFPPGSAEISRRAELDRTIRHFAAHFSKYDSVDQLRGAMVSEGFDPDFVQETESISTLAFGRTFFEAHGVQYAPTVIRARRDGRVETDVPLMSIPAYTRARALVAQLHETMTKDDFQALCLYSAESNVILKAMEAQGDKINLGALRPFPCVVPDRGVSDQTWNAAIAVMNDMLKRNRKPEKEKAWWKLW